MEILRSVAPAGERVHAALSYAPPRDAGAHRATLATALVRACRGSLAAALATSFAGCGAPPTLPPSSCPCVAALHAPPAPLVAPEETANRAPDFDSHPEANGHPRLAAPASAKRRAPSDDEPGDDGARSASSEASEEGTYELQGAIGPFSVRMTLAVRGQTLTGRYRYLSQRSYLALEGTLPPEPSDRWAPPQPCSFDERDLAGKKTGSFEGLCQADRLQRLTGRWVSPEGVEEPYSLAQIPPESVAEWEHYRAILFPRGLPVREKDQQRQVPELWIEQSGTTPLGRKLVAYSLVYGCEQRDQPGSLGGACDEHQMRIAELSDADPPTVRRTWTHPDLNSQQESDARYTSYEIAPGVEGIAIAIHEPATGNAVSEESRTAILALGPGQSSGFALSFVDHEAGKVGPCSVWRTDTQMFKLDVDGRAPFELLVKRTSGGRTAGGVGQTCADLPEKEEILVYQYEPARSKYRAMAHPPAAARLHELLATATPLR